MNDIDILTQRYLNGDTSLQEERLLADMIGNSSDATKEQKALAELLRGSAVHGDDEVEQWLAEDETALYDGIMAQRCRRRRALLTAAASVAVLLCLSLFLPQGGKSDGDYPVAAGTSAPSSAIVAPPSPCLAHQRQDSAAPLAVPVATPSPCLARQRQDSTVPSDTSAPPPQSAMKDFHDAIAMIGERLEKAADSAARAQAEQIVISDARLSRLDNDIQIVSLQ